MSCEQKVFLITGASSGIGAGIAEHLLARGAQLALVGRNADNLTSVAAKCTPTYGAKTPLKIVADITIEKDVERVIAETIHYFDRLDVLVNNAGILCNGTVETTTLQQFDSVMNLNLRAIFHLTQLAIPYLTKSQGNIVNISSVNGIRSFPGVIAYNISKAALDQFTKCSALEFADKGIRVNSVNPGLFLTNIHRRSGPDEKSYEELTKRNAAATFTTGTLLSVDGGKNLVCPR